MTVMEKVFAPAFGAEERAALVESVRRLLADRSDEAAVRATMETADGYDPALWRELAAMGVVGLLIDEAHGGTGLGPVELELVFEEVGAALMCGPLLSSGVLAAGLLQALGATEALAAIADGSRIATVALTGTAGGWTEGDVAVTAREGRLSGTAGFVTDAQVADLLIVVAREGDGVAIFAVEAGAATIVPLPTFDHSRRLAEVAFDDVAATRIGSGWAAVERALDLARVALAGEQAGGTRRMLAMTVQYARDRFQFGRSIGSFQAIKHMAADLLLESESATSAARHAAQQLADAAPDRAAAISLAAFACADAFVTTCATGIQMHGGIAFTWTHPAHLYLRRARADAQLFGTPAAYRERYIREIAA